VQLQNLQKIINYNKCKLFVRRGKPGLSFDNQKIKDVYNQVHCKPYDWYPSDLLDAANHTNNQNIKNHTDRFFCSALVGYFLHQFKIVSSEWNFSDCTPADLSSETENIKWVDSSSSSSPYLDDEELI